MIHTGKEAAAGKSAVQRKIVVKYLFFKANAKLENAFKKRAVLKNHTHFLSHTHFENEYDL